MTPSLEKPNIPHPVLRTVVISLLFGLCAHFCGYYDTHSALLGIASFAWIETGYFIASLY
jgi:hypothetical protein